MLDSFMMKLSISGWSVRKILLCSSCLKKASKWFQLVENLRMSCFFHKTSFKQVDMLLLKKDSKLSSDF